MTAPPLSSAELQVEDVLPGFVPVLGGLAMACLHCAVEVSSLVEAEAHECVTCPRRLVAYEVHTMLTVGAVRVGGETVLWCRDCAVTS